MDHHMLKVFKSHISLFIGKRKLPTYFVLGFPWSFLARGLMIIIRLLRKYLIKIGLKRLVVSLMNTRILIDLTEPPRNYEEALVYVFCGRNYEMLSQFRLNSKQKLNVIVDLGAHYGFFTLKASRKATKVIAIEPNPLALMKLKYQLAINNVSNVTVLPCVIRGFNGYSNLYIPITDTLERASVYDDHIGGEVAQIKVPAIKLSTLFKMLHICHIDLLKVDIEGAETEIISDKEAFKHCHIKRIVCEVHSGKKLMHVVKELKQIGYHFEIFETGPETYILYAWKRLD